MRYLLDTDTLSVLARDASAELAARVEPLPTDDLAISVITRGEVEFGIARKLPRRETLERMQTLLAAVATLPLTDRAVGHYAAARRTLERQGTPIGTNDLWIAAHAMSERLVLVTGNTRELQRVPGLQVENWLR